MIKRMSVVLLGLFFVVAGIGHFIKTSIYMQIMPPWLPYRLALVYISGVCEVLGGIGVLIPALRRLSGYGLIALLIAVLPANINMTLHSQEFTSIPTVLLWLRLPLQLLFLAWVWWSTNGSVRSTRSAV